MCTIDEWIVKETAARIEEIFEAVGASGGVRGNASERRAGRRSVNLELLCAERRNVLNVDRIDPCERRRLGAQGGDEILRVATLDLDKYSL